MGLVSKLLQLITFIGVLILFGMVVAAAVAAAQARPGCNHKCGDVEIPFPFGLSKDCYLNDNQSFNITCDGSGPKAAGRNLIVKNISIEAHEMHVLKNVAQDCYLESGALIPESTGNSHLDVAPFTISKTRNQFTVVGCDTYAFLRGRGYQNGENFSTGCASECSSLRNTLNGSCSAVGCCKAQFPDGLQNIEIQVHSFNNHTGKWNFNPCGYAFVVEKGKFNFSTNYLKNLPHKMLPMVLDWAIGNETCEEAKKKPNFACRNKNSICHVPETRSGYRCKCEPGYQGNPYLPDGCQDIDECDDAIRTHNCSTGCVNTPGGYTCRCPKWYHGNGTKDHGGCDADFVIIIRIVIGAGVGFISLLVLSSCFSFVFLCVSVLFLV
ncbi:hypothetical protein F2P56_012057 [Juglans regia]|uniref:Wall-associated receptor kinase 2-like n=2 Tax=Juglans regia TaxID=51240 RepID=A0A2I4H937_JUGRE|nr:wall-associated receptor kinase 2-like [Juglans regia]KAF5467845.1 hypothetical protein F2P56_012057 [Juglans regia]